MMIYGLYCCQSYVVGFVNYSLDGYTHRQNLTMSRKDQYLPPLKSQVSKKTCSQTCTTITHLVKREWKCERWWVFTTWQCVGTIWQLYWGAFLPVWMPWEHYLVGDKERFTTQGENQSIFTPSVPLNIVISPSSNHWLPALRSSPTLRYTEVKWHKSIKSPPQVVSKALASGRAFSQMSVFSVSLSSGCLVKCLVTPTPIDKL